MKKTKGFIKPSNIIHASKNQLGNTLIPVIIALAISAVASVAFLKQGAELSLQTKVLEAQYEVADLLQQWNRIKTTKDQSQITKSDLPPAIIISNPSPPDSVLGKLVLGSWLGLVAHPGTTSSGTVITQYVAIIYAMLPEDKKGCLKLASMFSSDMEGVSDKRHINAPKYLNSGNPACIDATIDLFIMRLD